MREPRILVVDDEAGVLSSLKMALTVDGYAVSVAADARQGRLCFAEEVFDAVLLDVSLPDGDGLSLLEEFKRASPKLLCIMMSGEATIDIAVRATQSGAIDFLEKPISTERLLVSLRNGLKLVKVEQEAALLRTQTGELSDLLGTSPAMARLRDIIARAARSSASVLVTGERGTGKELVAKAIHEASPRASGPLEKLNCAAVPENLIESELFGHEAGAFTGATRRRQGRFERADGGTLFLDEVGDMPESMQAKLLRVLQEQEMERVGGSGVVKVDVRVVAATNKNLLDECDRGRFRADLLDRLNVIPIALPPLRERSEDIFELSSRFLSWAKQRADRPQASLTQDAYQALEQLPLPGNVRELRNLVERLVILAPHDAITGSDVEQAAGRKAALPSTRLFRPGATFKELVGEAEGAIVKEALDFCGGQMAKTARTLGMERSHLYKKAKALGLRGESDN